MNDSVSEMITKKIDDIVKEKNIYYSGQVVRINNFIIEARGLDDAFYFEKVYINNENNIGYVDKIEANTVFISLIKTEGKIVAGDAVITTGEILEMSFSEDSVGMIIDPFGVDRMTGRKLNNSFPMPVETDKIGIMERTSVKRPLETGIAAIDLMFPIGRGQRQLIIGDKKTGKSQICLDTIVNQKDKNVLCIYVSIGKNKKELKNLYAKLIQKGANAYTIIVSAFNDDLPPLIKLTPYIALSIAEYYLKQGKDVLVCIDDLKKHADACREIALLSEKNTGRDAYPADIFYTHSRLLEKGCQHQNGGSITILPIVETKGGDITDYISTNIISITDGQIVLSDKMFKKGQKPAINYGLSVSRLGSDVQNELIKKVGAKVRRELLTYLEKVDVYQLVNIESMSPELQNQLNRGARILDALKQPKFSPISASELKERFAFIDEEEVVVEPKESVPNDSDNNSDDGGNANVLEPVEEIKEEEENIEEPLQEVPVEPIASVEPEPINEEVVVTTDQVAIPEVTVPEMAPVEPISEEVVVTSDPVVVPEETIPEVAPIEPVSLDVNANVIEPITPVIEPSEEVVKEEPVVEGFTPIVPEPIPTSENSIQDGFTPITPVENSVVIEPIPYVTEPVIEENNSSSQEVPQEPLDNEYIEKTEVLTPINSDDYAEQFNLMNNKEPDEIDTDIMPVIKTEEEINTDIVPVIKEEEEIDTDIVPIIKEEDNYER